MIGGWADSAKLARGRELARMAPDHWTEPATFPEDCPYPPFEDGPQPTILDRVLEAFFVGDFQ